MELSKKPCMSLSWLSILVACLLLPLQPAAGAHWAVLVAGSQGYYNYRHQADVCHAYQIMRSHGIPKEHIIVMMYDDVASSKFNPHRGQLFNKPDLFGQGDDVYDGCEIDYRLDEVTPTNFMKVLLGDTSINQTKTTTPKVLNSTRNDRVFINFVDHGAVGMIMFPNRKSLHALEFLETIVNMHMQNMYKELVIYVEACESGSMFQHLLPRNLNVFVSTAANARESSWAAYCPPNDFVHLRTLNTCLGDLYSVNWMEDSDLSDLSRETLEQQYSKVKNETIRSHVMQFGSNSIRNEAVSEFQTNSDTAEKSTADNVKHEQDQQASPVDTSVDSRDVALISKFYKYLRSDETDESRTDFANSLIQEVQHRDQIDQLFKSLQLKLFGGLYEVKQDYVFEQFKCHYKVNKAFERLCGPYTDYSLKYEKYLVYACEELKEAPYIVSIIQEECASKANFEVK